MYRYIKNNAYIKFVLEIAFSHVIVAHVVNHLLRELLRVSAHVSVHEQVATGYLKAVLEHGNNTTYNDLIMSLASIHKYL